jgi:hypothetical protein
MGPKKRTFVKNSLEVKWFENFHIKKRLLTILTDNRIHRMISNLTHIYYTANAKTYQRSTIFTF